jgi:hypothetical protein
MIAQQMCGINSKSVHAYCPSLDANMPQSFRSTAQQSSRTSATPPPKPCTRLSAMVPSRWCQRFPRCSSSIPKEGEPCVS